MPNLFKCSFHRYYGELEDDFDYTLYTQDLKTALLLLVSDLSGDPASTREEACQNSQKFLDSEIGIGWDVNTFLGSALEIWNGNDICYRVHDIRVLAKGEERPEILGICP